MLGMLQSIFRRNHTGPYPESLVRAAIEQAVDETDSCLRGVAGYRRKLRPVVIKALDQVMALVDGLEEPIRVDRAAFGQDSRLKLFFASAEHMTRVFEQDAILAALRSPGGGEPRSIYALLLMDYREQSTFGTASQGNILLKDVPQVAVDFSNHRLLDPTWEAEETLCLLRQRAYNHLLQIALNRIAMHRDKRAGLERRRTLLQAKARVSERATRGFSVSALSTPMDCSVLRKQADEIEGELEQLGCDTKADRTHFKLVVDVLSRPEAHLWSEPLRLTVDPMGIKRSPDTPGAKTLTFTRLHNARGQSAVASLVKISTPF